MLYGDLLISYTKIFYNEESINSELASCFSLKNNFTYIGFVALITEIMFIIDSFDCLKRQVRI